MINLIVYLVAQPTLYKKMGYKEYNQLLKDLAKNLMTEHDDYEHSFELQRANRPTTERNINVSIVWAHQLEYPIQK